MNRATPPPDLPMRPSQLPLPDAHTLPNGVRVLTLRSDNLYNGMQSPLGRALGLAYFAAFEGDPDGVNRALERLMAITPDDVQRAVQQYLHTTRNRTVMHIQAGAAQGGAA
jgi:predicted Zn-dependent peptidase